MDNEITDRIGATIGNYYGVPFVGTGNQGKRFIAIEDQDGSLSMDEVSEEFYQAWLLEFGKIERPATADNHI